MLATTVLQNEDAPATWPAAPAGLSDEAAAIDPAVIWQRLECWVAYRWTPRAVTWVIDGPGAWSAPLSPATVSASYRWNGDAWEDYTLPAGPFGHDLPMGQFKVVATVGGGDVPEPVAEAYRRLAEYSAEIGERGMLKDAPGASSYSADIGGSLQESFTRPSAWAARALQYSGAADLLRPYRRA